MNHTKFIHFLKFGLKYDTDSAKVNFSKPSVTSRTGRATNWTTSSQGQILV